VGAAAAVAKERAVEVVGVSAGVEAEASVARVEVARVEVGRVETARMAPEASVARVEEVKAVAKAATGLLSVAGATPTGAAKAAAVATGQSHELELPPELPEGWRQRVAP